MSSPPITATPWQALALLWTRWPRGSGAGLWERFAKKVRNALSLFIKVPIRKDTSPKIFINYKEKNGNFIVETHGRHQITNWSSLILLVISHIDFTSWCDEHRRPHLFCDIHTQNAVISSWKTSDQLKSRDILQKTNQCSSKDLKLFKYPSLGEYLNKLGHILSWSTQQEEWKWSIHTTTWMELKGIIISERKQSWEATYCKIILTQASWNDKTLEMENRLMVFRTGEWERQGDHCGSFLVYYKGFLRWNCSLMFVTQIHTW